MDITLVIPTYNEAGNIPILVEKVFKIFDDNELDGHIIIVDDDSPDQTWKVAENLKDKYPNLEVLRRQDKRGLSSAVLDGFQLADSEIVGVIDADLSHPPEKIPELVAPLIKGEADFTLGSRYIDEGGIENWPLKRKVSSKIATFAVLGLTKVKDPMSGFFFLKKEVINNVELSPKGFKVGLEILVRGNCERVIEVPIVFRDREYGESKLRSNVILDYLLHISKLYIYQLSKKIHL
jgi:dolichol-phosphate mannosyltransferase